VFLALLVGAAFSLTGFAQSELSFPSIGNENSTVTLTNPTDKVVEVEFSLFTLSGDLVPALVNPVRYEIGPVGRLSMVVEEVFATSVVDGDDLWIRITSPASGISGTLFATGSDVTVKAISESEGLLDQIVLIPDGGAGATRQLRVVNPSMDAASINVSIFNAAGVLAGITGGNLDVDSGLRIDLNALIPGLSGLLTARISSSTPVAAQSVVSAARGLILLNGQPASQRAQSLRIAPDVVFGGGRTSTLILSNPTGQPVTATVTLTNEDGGSILAFQTEPERRTFTLAANASLALGPLELTGLAFTPTVNGWLQVDTPSVPLGAAVVVSHPNATSAYPLQAGIGDQSYYSHLSGGGDRRTALSLMNSTSIEANVEMVVVDADGDILASVPQTVAGLSKLSVALEDLFPESVLERAGWVVLEGATGIYSVANVSDNDGHLAIVEPQIPPSNVQFDAIVDQPILLSVTPMEARPGDRLRMRTRNAGNGTVFLFGDQVVEPASFIDAFSVMVVDVPQVAPGFVDLRLRAPDGSESDPVTILVAPTSEIPIRTIQGRAFYQKVVSSSTGLDLNRPVAVPIRGARVQVFDQATGTLFALSSTDTEGRYRIPAPEADGFVVRVLSVADGDGTTIADNTSNGAVYAIGSVLGAGQPATLVATDASRVSGAFNILEVMRLGSRLLNAVEPDLAVPGPTIFWTPRNTRAVGDSASGAIGGTFFDAASNTAFVLGDRFGGAGLGDDRLGDSDEFDDSVILHEYAHMLAARFSRDDSSGGEHFVGDVLDPRVAWSEGWANFFSSFARDDAVYRDTFGPGGSLAVEYDLDQNFIPGDAGGYWSEFSIHSLLWDLVDVDDESGDDAVAIGFEQMWQAFRLLAAGDFVYAPAFLDQLVATAPLETSLVEQLARSRTIDYLASADPTISNPFPRIIQKNVPMTGEVDSATRGRANLAQSSHLFTVDIDGGPVSIRMDVTGLGPAGNVHANDLDLFLLDSSGRAIARSDRGLDGQSELISTFLPAGRYVVEVRSFYTQASTGNLVFNSGQYRLTILTP